MKKSNLSSKNKNFDLASFMNGNGRIYLMLIVSAFTIFLTVAGFDTINELKYNYELYPAKEFGYSFSNWFTLEYTFIALAAALLGATSFQFLTVKQWGVTMLSLPLKRSKLFNKSVILPVCGLALIVVAVKAYMISCNIKIFGVNSDLIIQGVTDIFVCLKYVLLGFTAFCVSSVACGKKIEVAFGGFSLIGIMPVAYKVVDTLLDMYLYGYDSILYSITKSYSDFVFIFNPARELSVTMLFAEMPSYTTDKLVVSAIWIVVLILVLAFTKQYFIKSYKPEKIEMKSTNKPMLAIIGAFIGLTVAEIVLDIIITESAYNNFEVTSGLYLTLLCVLTVIFAFLTICLIETSFKLNKNKLIAVLSPLSIIALILVFSFTGGLGYEKRMPDTKDIKSIEISTTFYGSSTFNTDSYPSVLSVFPDSCMTFTSENDFKVIKGIHETTLENRDTDTSESICITYVFKDGRSISRVYYDLSKEATEKLLTLWKTEAEKKDVEDYLLNNKPTNGYGTLDEGDSYYRESYSFYEKPYSVFNYEQNNVFIASKQNIGINIKDKITEAEFTRIKEAIYKDYCELTAKEWFKPTKTYGAIVFKYNGDYYGDYYDEEVVYESDTAEIVIENGVPPVNDGTTEAILWGGFSDYDQVVLPVTAEMKNTISVLKSLDLYQYLSDSKVKINRMLVADAKEYFEWENSAGLETALPLLVLDNSVYFVPDYDLESGIKLLGKKGVGNPIENYFGDEYEQFEEYYDDLAAEYDYSTAPVIEIKNQKERAKLLTEVHIKYYDEEQKGKILFVDYVAGIDTAYYIPA